MILPQQNCLVLSNKKAHLHHKLDKKLRYVMKDCKHNNTSHHCKIAWNDVNVILEDIHSINVESNLYQLYDDNILNDI